MGVTKVSVEDLVRVDSDSIAGNYLRDLFWQPVATSASLSIGHVKPFTLLGITGTLYRGESGIVHAVASHCPHRLTRLSTAYVEDDCIRCFYHGWKFSPNGNCIEQPINSSSTIPNVSITTYRVTEYLGLIFVFLGNGECPPMIKFPALESSGILITADMTPWDCNFFVMIEGATDWGHTVYTHRRSGLADLLPSDFSFKSIENEYGILTMDTSSEKALLTGSTQFFMPNINFFDVPFDHNRSSVLCLIWRVPIDNSNVLNFLVAYSNGDVSADEIRKQLGIDHGLHPSTIDIGRAIVQGEKSLDDDDVINRVDLVQIEDYIAQVGQLGPSVSKKCLLTDADKGITIMRRIWLRELGHYINGRPLKKWAHLGNEAKLPINVSK